ncbi:MAG: M1 family aminopeptidase [Flavobacteriia bacterium]|jgi:aminopeptidase N|nr:T9SS type A sorting domain-containing protein [Cryomorphaceae bacterium]
MKFVLAVITSVLSLTASSQEIEHTCSEAKIHAKHNGVKTLTSQEEVKANAYNVHFYSLDLNMTNQSTLLSGTAEIHGTLVQNLDTILLELFPSQVITELRLNGVSSSYSRVNSLLKIGINQAVGSSFIISVDYNGTPPTSVQNPFGGSGVSNATVSAIGNKVTWTVSCPFLAHEWFPCKQILRDKADSSAVRITVPNGLIATSNGVLQQTENLGNGFTRFTWKNHHPILYYLICATIAPYTEYVNYAYPINLPGDSIMVQNFIYGNSSGLSQAEAQCDLLPSFIELYSEKFGLYPFSDEKYGISIAPLSGGMEHQTMTTVGVMEKKINTHELCHQWWGDYVGIASFSDVWLSEGFATYGELVMLENFYPTETVSLVNAWHSSVLTAVGGSVWHTDTLNIARIYNSRLTYKKGGAIIHTLRHIINNDSLFYASLRSFLNAYGDSVAVGLDLKAHLEAATGIDLTPFFEQWYFGEGYPTISARWNSIGNDVLLEINHTTSMPASVPFFSIPLELRFNRNGLPDTIVRVEISDNSDQFYLSGLGTVTNLNAVDPNNWIINKNGTIIQDPTFTASTENITTSDGLLIYPNPSAGEINISWDEEVSALRIMDSKGQIVQIIDQPMVTPIRIEGLKSGMYILEITSKNATRTQRRIISL